MGADLDLVVLGAGSGGLAAAKRAARHGARVAIVEGDRVGGTCVIRGCVPTKLMVFASGYGAMSAEAQAYGWDIPEGPFVGGDLAVGLQIMLFQNQQHLFLGKFSVNKCEWNTMEG